MIDFYRFDIEACCPLHRFSIRSIRISGVLTLIDISSVDDCGVVNNGNIAAAWCIIVVDVSPVDMIAWRKHPPVIRNVISRTKGNIDTDARSQWSPSIIART